MPTFFLSYSSSDKEFVRSVADVLGKDRCWFDEWKLSGGEDIFHSIDAALDSSETGVFAIFWSQYASQSKWVAEESAHARMRKLRREDIEIVPIRLDNTPLPPWMERLVYIESTDIAIVAERLSRTIEKLPTILRSARTPPDNSFQNRVKEAQQIEEAYHNAEVGCAIVTGFPGIGKTALCRFMLRNTLPNLNGIWIDCEAANSPALFFATLAQRSSVRLPESVVESGRWADYWADWIKPTIDIERDSLILDSFTSALTSEGRIPKWLEVPLNHLTLAGPNRLPLILISSRRLDLGINFSRHSREINLGKLSESDIIRTLRVRLASSHPRREAVQDQLEKAANLISGYPLAAQLWAAYAVREGVELALADPSPVQRQVKAFVGDIVSRIGVSDSERRTLLILALARFPMQIATLVNDLNVQQEDLHKLGEAMLLDPGVGGFGVHALVASHIAEDVSAHALVKKVHEELGTLFKRQWKNALADVALTAAMASQAYYHLLAAGSIEEAQQIAWSFADEAGQAIVELYRTRQDELVIQIGESLSSLGRSDPKIQYYYALALSRRNEANDGQRAIAITNQLLQDSPENRYYWQGLGDIQRRFKNLSEAKEAYLKARALARSDDAMPSSRLGEMFQREGDLASAAFFLGEAYKRAPNDPRIMASYASLLQAQGRPDEALTLVRIGLRRRSDDIALNHRAGLILREMGKNIEALPHLSRAARGDSLPASFLSLADLFLEMGRINDAKRTLSQHPGKKTAAYYNIEGNIARREGRFVDAERCFEKCKSMEGASIFLLGSIAGLRLSQAEKAIETFSLPAAKAYWMQADEAVRKGLDIQSENGALLKLRSDSENLKRRILREEQGLR